MNTELNNYLFSSSHTSTASESPARLVEPKISGLQPPEFLIQYLWVEPPNSFCTYTQVMLTLLRNFENPIVGSIWVIVMFCRCQKVLFICGYWKNIGKLSGNVEVHYFQKWWSYVILPEANLRTVCPILVSAEDRFDFLKLCYQSAYALGKSSL